MVRWLVRILAFIVLILLLAPLWTYVWWLVSPKYESRITIVDKTIPNKKYLEHKSFTWILHHERLVKAENRDFYSYVTDYSGFDPRQHPKAVWRDWDYYSNAQLDSISDNSDLFYITDTYGVYYNEWILNKELGEHSQHIYGGMKRNELYVLEQFIDKGKSVIAEFNTFASPTSGYVKERAQEVLNVDWTGWVGRYFDELDSTKNAELPKWLVRGYMEQHNGVWNFEGPGLVFVNESERIEIFDPELGLINDPMPMLEVTEDFAKQYGTVTSVKYPYWFEITNPRNNTDARSMGKFVLNTTAKGDALLADMGVSNVFPSMIKSRGGKTWYFCADFADNEVPYAASYFKRINWLGGFLYTSATIDRSRFFWKFYRPFMKTILEEQEILPK